MIDNKILWITPLVPKIFFLICLFYYKIKLFLIIAFNSYLLLMANIFSLLLFHLSLELKIFKPKELYNLIFSSLFIFSYIIRIKRILDFLSLSNIFKIGNIKDKEKSKILFEKTYYSSEFFYFIQLIFISSIYLLISYFYKKIIIIRYTTGLISLFFTIFFVFKILKSDMKKKLKKSYSCEIIIFFILSLNIILSYIKIPSKFILQQRILLYLLEILYITLLSINCEFFSLKQKLKQNCLLNKKLNSDLCIFLNNGLFFHSFNNYLNKNDSESITLLKLYLDISIYSLNYKENEDNSQEEQKIIDYFNNNKQNIKNDNLKEKFENFCLNKNDKNILDEIYKIIYNILNKKFKEYKKDKEYEKVSTFFDLILYLDEYIFKESYYFQYFENQQLESI